MSKIFFEKICDNKILSNWTKLYNNVDVLLEDMKKDKSYLLGENMELRIREVKEYYE